DVVPALELLDYQRHPVLPGFLMGIGAIGGDAAKSFFKRQLGIAPGASWIVLDQLDFFLGASLLVAAVTPLPPLAWAAALPVVFTGDVLACILAYRLGLKDAWI